MRACLGVTIRLTGCPLTYESRQSDMDTDNTVEAPTTEEGVVDVVKAVVMLRKENEGW